MGEEGQRQPLENTQVGQEEREFSFDRATRFSSPTRHKEEYRGETIQTTSILLRDLLPKYLAALSKRCAVRPDLILALWPQVVGPQIASMTRPLRFERAILYVAVKNSTLLSILSSGGDKKRILHELSSRVPGIPMEDIVFRFG